MSHKNIGIVSIDRVFAALRRARIVADEGDVIEWTGEALEQIGAITSYEEAVCFVTVDNFTAKMPKGSHTLIQAARNNCYREENIKASCACAGDIIKDYNPVEDEGTVIEPLAIDENGEFIEGYQLAYYRPFFDLQYEYLGWTRSNIYKSCFTPIRLTENTFFNSLVCKENDYDQIYHNCKDEYNLKQGKVLTFSFKTGQVALSYTRQTVDSKGFPMIPDEVSYVTAIVEYIRWQMMTREYYAGVQGAEGRMKTAEDQWIWYCGQAGNKSMMLEGVDEHQNFIDQRNYLIPPQNRYYSFFGNMNQPENRGFLNPGRNLLRGL